VTLKKRNETDNLYRQLARFLDELPGGFPPTKSGVELRILRRLFTPKEAELALHLTVVPEEAQIIAQKTKRPLEETARRLEDMAGKGLIYRRGYPDRPPKFSAQQYVIGIWEYHVNDLDPQLIRDMEEYIPTLLNIDVWKKAPQLRTVPVGESIPVQHNILAHEKAENLVGAHKKFLVAPCICRRERRMVGEGCDKPEEACLILGRATDYYKHNNIGREISRDEALALLKEADRTGLVLQPSNSQRIANICMCCGCCCAVLRTIKKHPQPSSIVSSPYRASHSSEGCTACGVCVDRCPMEAIELDGEILFHEDHCIGCGLCVTTCPTESLVLVRKPADEQRQVPETLLKSYIHLTKIRKKLKPLRFIRSWLKSRLIGVFARKAAAKP
jgi:ferredoxin